MTESAENVGQNTESQSVDDRSPSYVDPFDFGDRQEPIESRLSFDLDDDGELQISGLPGEDDPSEEQEEVEQKSREGSERVEEDPNYLTDPFEGDLSPREQQLLEQNKKLEERLEKLEGKVTSKDVEAKKAEKEAEAREKLDRAGFDEDQIEAILEINPIKVEEEYTESEESEEQESSDEIDQEQLNKEVGEVFKYYNGEGDKPSVQEMKPYVDFVAMRFGQELNQFPVISSFRLAENAPFIQWLDNKYRGQTIQSDDGKPILYDNLSARQIFNASENLRKLYYKERGKPVSSYDHLRMSTKENNSDKSNKPSNEEIHRLSQEHKLETSKNVPGGEVETEEELKERRRPKDARTVATSVLNSFMGEE